MDNKVNRENDDRKENQANKVQQEFKDRQDQKETVETQVHKVQSVQLVQQEVVLGTWLLHDTTKIMMVLLIRQTLQPKQNRLNGKILLENLMSQQWLDHKDQQDQKETLVHKGFKEFKESEECLVQQVRMEVLVHKEFKDQSDHKDQQEQPVGMESQTNQQSSHHQHIHTKFLKSLTFKQSLIQKSMNQKKEK
nr:MAG TPA: hypothetical protein [Bacteriophage sp.]